MRPNVRPRHQPALTTARTGRTKVAEPNRRAHVLAVTDLACERGMRCLFTGLSFELHAGELLQVEGANGSGKTSLLRILCDLAPATAGAVRLSPVPAMRHALGYLGHSAALSEALTPREHLDVHASLFPGADRADMASALAHLGLAEAADTLCRHLSAGQQRRVALARLAITPAALWVLDEPLTALDHAGVALVRDLLQRQLDRGGAVVLTTHQPIAMRVHQRVLLKETPWAL